MAFTIKDEDTDKLVREYARSTNLGLTAAIHKAVRAAILAERQTLSVEDVACAIEQELRAGEGAVQC